MSVKEEKQICKKIKILTIIAYCLLIIGVSVWTLLFGMLDSNLKFTCFIGIFIIIIALVLLFYVERIIKK